MTKYLSTLYVPTIIFSTFSDLTIFISFLQWISNLALKILVASNASFYVNKTSLDNK